MAYKMVFCLRRLPHLSAAEFARYWREDHAALFDRFAEAIPVQRYTQSHRSATPLNDALRSFRGAPDGFDGVAEVWFESLESLQAALLSPQARAAGAALIEDERNFIDHAASPIFITEEIVVRST